MDRSRRCGFSLLELLVALVFLGLLLAGMIRVFQAGLKDWLRVNETLSAQRALRWSLDRMAEDLRMMGHLFPPPELRTLELAASADPGLQSAFMLEPDLPVRVARRGTLAFRAPGQDPFEAPGRTADALSFVMDVPVPVRAVLAEPVPGLVPEARDGSETEDPARGGAVRIRAAHGVRLGAGDLVVVADGAWEFAEVLRPARLQARRPAEVLLRRPGGAGAGGLVSSHAAGAPVRFIRPLRVVRYGVVYLALDDPQDPRNPGGLVPCLVRWEVGYPPDRAAPPWARLLSGRPGPTRAWEVVAEQIIGLRVDFSLDNRFPGIRGADWPETVRNLDAALRTRHRRDGEAARSDDPFWFRKYGGLLQVTLEARGPVPRDEYAPAGERPARRFRYRSQTLLVRPRNFGLEAPE